MSNYFHGQSPNGELENNDTSSRRGGTISKHRRYPDPTDPTPGRPHYYGLWEKACNLALQRDAQPVAKKQLDSWIHMQLDLQEDMLPLNPPDGMGFPRNHLRRGDLKGEQKRIAPALEKARDMLAFCAEVLQRDPPEDLRHIEQILRSRLNELERKQSRQTPKP